MSFQALMDELDLMAKAQNDAADGDDKIKAAAADGGDPAAADTAAGAAAADDGDPADAAAAAPAGDGDGDGDEPMGKSFSFKLEDGTEVEAVDGTDLVKALMARVETNENNMTKALTSAVGLIKSQGDLIKSLQEQVGKLSTEGRGRKAVVSVAERPTVLKKSDAEEPGITPTEFLAKCLQAQAAGKITGNDVARAEAYLNRGQQVPTDIVARVAAQ